MIAVDATTSRPWLGWAQSWTLAVAILVGIHLVTWWSVRLVVRTGRGAPATAASRPKDASPGSPLWMFVGRDGRWSTSKATAVLWTEVVLWALLTILLRTGGENIAGPAGGTIGFPQDQLQPEYLIVMGIPFGAAVLAKAVTSMNVAERKVTTKDGVTPNLDPIRGFGELVADDFGRFDLLDFQYLAFNLLLLGYFLVSFLHIAVPQLPNLPNSLFAISGVSAATYIAKKTQEGTAPGTAVLVSVTPSSAAIGETITVYAANLDPDLGVPSLNVAGRGATCVLGASGSQNTMTCTVPDGVGLGAGHLQLVGQATAATLDFTVLTPEIRAVVPPLAAAAADVTVRVAHLSRLDAAPEVTFGGIRADGPIVPTYAGGSTAIACKVPATAAVGICDVVVTTPGQVATPGFAYTIGVPHVAPAGSQGS